MKLGMDHIGEVTDEKLRFLAQLGVEGVMAEPAVIDPDGGFFDYAELLHLRSRVESFGMTLAAVSGNSPWRWNYRWMLGLPGRDEQIEHVCTTIRNLGAAGIPVFTYNMHVARFYRTSDHAPLRAGARGSSFDARLVESAPWFASTSPDVDTSLIPPDHRGPLGDEQLWANLTYFLQAVVPVADEAGVSLGIHPDDPQVPEIGGVARIMRTPDAFRRVTELVPSDRNGLLFCVGCFTEMGADVPAELSFFGERGKLAWVHFRNTSGSTDRFNENFPELGDTDLYRAMVACRDAGYEGYFTPDHCIDIEGDSSWGHRYWAYALGFIRALLMAVTSE